MRPLRGTLQHCSLQHCSCVLARVVAVTPGAGTLSGDGAPPHSVHKFISVVKSISKKSEY